nr:hypothetical protein BHI3_26000 [Bacteriovorax sp. HI3]
MKYFTLSLLLLSSLAFAGDRNTAYNQVCKPMSFDSDRTKCTNTIRPFSYFNDDALQMCSGFNFDSKKIECLGYIGDKMYEFFEIDTCRNMVFDSERMNCLKNSGSPNRQTCLPKTEVINQLRAAQYEIRSGQIGTADKRLEYVIGRFSNPNCQ